MDVREECISAEAEFTAHSGGKESVFLFFFSLGHTAIPTVYRNCNATGFTPKKRQTKRMKSMNESNKRSAINQFSLLQTQKKKKERKKDKPSIS